MLQAVLKKYWGYSSFRPLQAEAMDCVMNGQDSLVVLPTGGGKSLCYQAPALCLPGLAVVVSPLISLMKDQVDSLLASDIPAAFINSTQTVGQRREVADQIRDGSLRLLYISPERLAQDKTIEYLQSLDLSFIAIDEAHCISEWGHDFRPEYRELAQLRDKLPNVSVHAFTATATEHVRQDIAEQLRLRDPQVLVGSFDRPNLLYRCERMDGRLDQIREVMDRHPKESGIIYCTSRRDTDDVSAQLNELGYRTRPYHAGMTDGDRKQNQEAFIQESIETIVATVAFGMGIDKSNVRYVIHSGMPKALENYQQESGRAGRDSLEAECVIYYSMSDYVRWKRMIEDAGGSNYEPAMASLKAMIDYCTGVNCRHRQLVSYFGQEFHGVPCNACDVCLGDLDLVAEPLVLGQKILSSVIRQGQNYGAEYTVLVLKGSSDQRILRNGHDALSTYGLLSAMTPQAIRDWIEQLVAQDFLIRSGEYGVLEVTTRGRELLKGDAIPRLLKPKEKKEKARGSVARIAVSWEGVDRDLFDELRSLRAGLAFDAGVPAYVVFTDATLRELSLHRPSTLEGMRDIKGIGEKKLADYGQAFLDAILEYCTRTGTSLDQGSASAASSPAPSTRGGSGGRSASKLTAYRMFREGRPVEEVAIETDRAESTVRGYLTDFIADELLTDATAWVDPQMIPQIEAAASIHGTEKLKPIFDTLQERATYDDIRIVLVCLKNRESRGRDE